MEKAIPPQAWMTDPRAGAVFAALRAAGGPDAARFVGGCVRDLILKRPVGERDVATVLTPPDVIKALEDKGLRALPTGLEHGTVTALSGGEAFEITTLREDVETDGRRARVSFTTDWALDARRRDFTLNALYLTPEGVLFDPTGQGEEDARAGRVRFVGEALARVREDRLRILRFFRFQAGYGAGPPDPEALEACRREREGLRRLSAERVAKELLRLLAAPAPEAALHAMRDTGVLSEILPEVSSLERLEGLVEIEAELFRDPDPPLRLAALLPQDPQVVAAVSRRLRLSKALEERLRRTAEAGERLVSWMSPREMRRALYRLGPQAFRDQVLLAWAAGRRPAAFPQWRMLLAYADLWTPPPFPIGGEEAAAAGVPRGPLIGEILREVEAFWIDLDFTDDRLALLERLKAVAQGLAY